MTAYSIILSSVMNPAGKINDRTDQCISFLTEEMLGEIFEEEVFLEIINNQYYCRITS